jgi:hypothetical protein
MPPFVVGLALPGAVEAIISRCLARDPADRYPSAHALLVDVQRLATVVSTPRPDAIDHAQPAADGRTVLGVARDNWPIVFAALALILVLALGISVVYTPPSAALKSAPSEAGMQKVAEAGALPPSGKSTYERPVSVRIDVFEGPADGFRDGKRLGTTPYQFTGKPGERINFTLKRKGYRDRHETVDIPEKDQPFVFGLEKATER